MASQRRLSQWSAAHHGVVRTADLAGLGISKSRAAVLREVGVLETQRRGVHVVAAAAGGELQRIAVVAAATGGVASFVTAGRLWGFRRLPLDPLVHVTVAHRRTIRPRGLDDVRVHRTRDLPTIDLVRRRDGVVVTSPPRTAFDLASVVGAGALESIIEQCLDREMCTIGTLWGVARRLARRGRPGSTAFVELLASREHWRRPVGSDLELALEQALRGAGLPRPERQWPIVLPDGATVHPDLVWPDLRLAVEVDHVTWHGGRLDSTYDKRRDRQLRVLGWEVDRVTDEDLRRRRAGTVKELVALYRRRSFELLGGERTAR